MSQLFHKDSRGFFSSFKQLLDQLLPESACWIGESRKSLAACAVWNLTKLNFTIYSLSALNTLFIESYIGYLLFTVHKVCFTQLASTPKVLFCSHTTEKAKWEMGVRDAVRCGCREKWPGCSQSPVRNRVPRNHPSPCSLLTSLSGVLCKQHFTENLCLWSDISDIPSLSSLKVTTYLFNEGFFLQL